MLRSIVAGLAVGLILICGLRPAIASEFTVRIRSATAPMLRSPQADAQVIAKADEGDFFTAVTEVGEYYLVKDLESESWLYIHFADAEEITDHVPDNILFAWQMTMPSQEDLSYWQVSAGEGREDNEEYKLRSGSRDGMLTASNGKKYPANYDYNSDYMPRVDGVQFVRDAYEYLGAPYVSGGTTKKGIDCSGLTQVCLAKQGIDVVHRSSLQALEGRYIAYDQLQPGDVIFFRDKSDKRYLSHVGIYTGRGMFIHASLSLGGVNVTSLNDRYFKQHYAFARRF